MECPNILKYHSVLNESTNIYSIINIKISKSWYNQIKYIIIILSVSKWKNENSDKTKFLERKLIQLSVHNNSIHLSILRHNAWLGYENRERITKIIFPCNVSYHI